ncbi:Peptidylglycine alpha-hydroxylating monooxygenase [Cryptotermes secundus]|uniref:peptidylglycine monooxygenase n=1 Tax=Cryptotermes secundus TaxID=105785 RepID=A0A2J7R3P3_9NEOP|nr:peptidylglycine alpha-hydroxylating monooxygenase [Cryptotermes secundus]PNF35453.1 Peptidylglycine alpha-hydroxylating monooxygenase [Cryptotermes secundus]
MAVRSYHMVAVALIIVTHYCCLAYKVEKFSFLMPNVKPYRPELYLCTPVKVDYSKSYYIVGFEPNATMKTTHHMLLYGCTKPGSRSAVWNCGEMSGKLDTSETASPCAVGSQVIYAWARDAPELELPEGVGFKVGGKSPIQYLVLQVHYATSKPFEGGKTDDSGIHLHYTERPLEKEAGVLLLGTGGSIEPMSVEKMETSCMINEKKVLHPFAYRTHTHSLGKVVSGYHIRRDSSGVDHWILLGKRNPLTPQMFYPVENQEPIVRGDKVAARCTMQSTRNRTTYTGLTNNDEMCNFYLMYWVERDSPLQKKYCFTDGPPFYYWASELNNIPDEDASTL